MLTRGYRQIQEHKVCVITGASRGIGLASAKELTSRLKSADIYLTTRGDTEYLNMNIKEDVGDKADMVNFHTMDVTDVDSIVEFRNMVNASHGKVDILINNAGQYYDLSSPLTQGEQIRKVETTLNTNYWGMKDVCQAFLPMLTPAARIVNLSSHLGHLSLIPGENLKNRFGNPDLTEVELDLLVREYQEHSRVLNVDYEAAGWPVCAYSVSKVAVNAYTRILQKQLEELNKEGVVVNALHPGSKHSKIAQLSPLTAADAAKAVVSVALLADPCQRPRGQFIWHDLQIVDWDRGSLKGMWA